MDKLWTFYNIKSTEKNPSELIYKFASRLEKDTNGLIIGVVSENTSDGPSEIIYGFYLMTPRLKNYSYRLFQFEFKSLVKPYPIKCIQYAKLIKDNQHFDCKDFYEFESELKGHITNEITKSILTSIKTHLEIVEHYSKN